MYPKSTELMNKWLGANYKLTQAPGPAAASTRKYYSQHQGYDYGTPIGTKIKSGVKGKVVYSGWDNAGWGNRVGVYDPTTNKTTYLSHLSNTLVKPGQEVNVGDLLGYTGNTGNSTGPHVDITEYGGNVARQASRATVSNNYSPTQSASYSDYLKSLFGKAKQKYGKSLIAISRDPNKLKKMGLKVQRIEV